MLSTSAPDMSTDYWAAMKAEREKKPPFVLGVAGGTASGKTSVCQMIIAALKDRRVSLISQDSFYRSLTQEEKATVSEYNFDHPDAFDWALMNQTLSELKQGKPVEIPLYDFVTHSRLSEHTTIYGADIIILEGILVFYPSELRGMFDMKIFVDADADTRLARRVIRDINHRGRDVMGVLRQYEKFVKPAFDEYINPTKKYADVIIPRGADNTVAIDLIAMHIRTQLNERDPKSMKPKKTGWTLD